MTYRELYSAALRMICEDSVDTGDYEDRAGYILASFCESNAATDRLYREATDGASPTWSVTACITLDDTFPLCNVFLPAAEYYLAAMLAIDENEEMSDRFFGLYADAIASITNSLPAMPTPIVDRYQGLLQ